MDLELVATKNMFVVTINVNRPTSKLIGPEEASITSYILFLVMYLYINI